jgi:hypothetical protein
MKFNIYLFGLLFVGMYPLSAYSYMDPATGSVILQSIIGMIAAGLFFIKTYWYKLKRFFLKIINKGNN